MFIQASGLYLMFGFSVLSSFSLYRVYWDCPWIPLGSDMLRHAPFDTFPVPAVGMPWEVAACRDL